MGPLKKRNAEPKRLEPGTLARFIPGLDWPSMYALDRTRGRAWWRMAVADAEERGLLWWDREGRSWQLTSDGVEAVRDVS